MQAGCPKIAFLPQSDRDLPMTPPPADLPRAMSPPASLACRLARGWRRAALAALLALPALPALLASLPAWALDPPKGKVLLSITGQLTRANAAGRADFDRAMLDALPQHSFTTSTPWYKAPHKFSGPLLRDVLAAAGAQGSTLRAVALNDYKGQTPADDAQRYKVLMATRLDDKPMTLRERGPLFIIYPYDDSADLRSERYYSRSAWQLRRLEVR